MWPIEQLYIELGFFYIPKNIFQNFQSLYNFFFYFKVEMISEDDLARRATFPEINDIRSIAAHLATRVMIQAHEEGVKVSSDY